MAKPSTPYPSPSQPPRSHSVDQCPASLKVPERRHSLPPPSQAERDSFSPSLEASSVLEDEEEHAPSGNAVGIISEMDKPADPRTEVSPSSRPIPVYQGTRTPMKSRGRARSTRYTEGPVLQTWGAPQPSPTVYPHGYPAPYYHVYTPSPTNQASPLPSLMVPPAWPLFPPVHGSPGAYHPPPHAQFPSANHGPSYSNALNLQGVPSLYPHAAYASPPPPQWPVYHSQTYAPARGSPSGPANGHPQPPVNGGQGRYPPQR
ncbi:hypothetical protein PENSPDRAFT_680091 [Peniophora sp. CONT]|nr:hypothetical protein PENSPDRAFT_680091 [Peniophora sp. CONT]